MIKKLVSYRSVSSVLTLMLLMVILLSSTIDRINPVRVVSSSSMEPTLRKGDIVFIVPCRIEVVEVGDIIAFYSKLQRDLVVHRVVEKRIFNNKVFLITKGDNNLKTDQEYGEEAVSEKNFVGRLMYVRNNIFKIPILGYCAYVIRRAGTSYGIEKKDFWYAVIFSLIIFMFVLSFIQLSRYSKNKIFALYKNERLGFISTFLFFFIIIAIIFISLHLTVAFSERGPMSPYQRVYVYNPTAIPMRGFIAIEQENYLETIPFEVSPEELKVFKKTYRDIKKITVYSSIFWLIVPENLIAYLGKLGKLGVVIIDILSALLFSLLLSAIILSIDILIDLYQFYKHRRFYKRGRAPVKKALTYEYDAAMFSVLCGSIFGFSVFIFIPFILLVVVFSIFFRIHPYLFSISSSLVFTTIILWNNNAELSLYIQLFVLSLSIFSILYVYSLIVIRIISEVIFYETLQAM